MSISAIRQSVQAERAKHQKNLDAAKKNYVKTQEQAEGMLSKAKMELGNAANQLQAFEAEVKEALNPTAEPVKATRAPSTPAKNTTAAAKAPVKKATAKKTTAAAKPVEKAAAKPAPKASAKKTTAKKASAKKTTAKAGPKRAASKRAAEGRRAVAEGKRPPIKDAMAQVMGEEMLNADEIHARLEKNGWLPNAKNPRAYVAYLLSATKEKFERVPSKGRGFYKVAGTTSKSNGHGKKDKAETPAAPKSEAKVEKSEPDAADKKAEGKKPTADDVLAELGFKAGEESAAFGT